MTITALPNLLQREFSTVPYIDSDDTEFAAYRSLARAKILTHLQDLFGRTYGDSDRAGRLQRRQTALRWFFNARSDFGQWADMAGMDPSYLQMRVRELMETNEFTMPKWRNAPGEGRRSRRKLH